LAVHFFGAFPTDRAPKTTKDVTVHSFIYSLTFRDKLVMDNALAAKMFLYIILANSVKFLNLRIY